MKIFLTGATGYIGGSLATALLAAGHEVTGLVRSKFKTGQVSAMGVKSVIGTLDDEDILRRCASDADAVIHTADADHENSAMVMLDALIGTGKSFIHTSGSSIVGTLAGGARLEHVYDEETPFRPSPGRAARVALNHRIIACADRGLRVVIICPSLIYGAGRGPNPDSMQVPWLIDLARRDGIAKHLGPGQNRWSNVHIDDLVDLYLAALSRAPTGAFYFAENGENSMRELCEAINRMMGVDGEPQEMSLDEAAEAWGRGPAENTMGSNSRVRAVRARQELGWDPSRPSVIEEIERGCYATG